MSPPKKILLTAVQALTFWAIVQLTLFRHQPALPIDPSASIHPASGDASGMEKTRPEQRGAMAASNRPTLTPERDVTRLDVTRNQFYVRKVMAGPAFDVVVAGDSRVACGVAPHVMQRSRPGSRIINYGFVGAAWTNEYMDAAEALLDPNANLKIIVTGISPCALTTIYEKANMFTKYYHMPREQRVQILKTDKLLQLFESIQPNGDADPDIVREFYSDYWVASVCKPTHKAFRYFRARFAGNPLNPDRVEGVIARVAAWNKRGIHVYGYFSPTSNEMWQLEDKLTGLDRDDFVRRFEKAGGVWLTFDHTRYQWADGHHMNKEVALLFSDDLGHALSVHENPVNPSKEIHAASGDASGMEKTRTAEQGETTSTHRLTSTPNSRQFANEVIQVTDRQFFVQKFSQPRVFDIVIGGDSRSLGGVSPEEMKKQLPDDRIYNFAFRGICWTTDYLDALVNLIEPASKRKSVILGISPLSLTPVLRDSNGFRQVKNMRPSERFQILKLDDRLAGLGLVDEEAEGGRKTRYMYHSDGWIKAYRRENRRVIADIPLKFGGSTIDGAIVSGMMERIREWSTHGITVYGFRPPTSPEVQRLEDETVGFNQRSFVEQFSAAGGVWLEIPGGGYEWNDGHHLDVPSALVFSDRLAKALRAVGKRDEPAANRRSN